MNQITVVTVSGIVALAGSLVIAYWLWLRSVGTMDNAYRQKRLFSAVPLLAGMCLALLLMTVLSTMLASEDRFFTPANAMRLYSCLGVSFLLVLLPGIRVHGSWIMALLFQLIAAAIAVYGGVRFDVLKFFTVPLGGWAVPLTILWLILATGVVRLLDGLDGSAPLLLLVTAIVVLVGAIMHNEFVLSALCAAVIGATLGGLRFHIAPARLPLRGPAASLFGFTFAVLTVLARQKTETALLIMLPLAVIIILVAGATLSFLEKGLTAGTDNAAQENDEEQR